MVEQNKIKNDTGLHSTEYNFDHKRPGTAEWHQYSIIMDLQKTYGAEWKKKDINDKNLLKIARSRH